MSTCSSGETRNVELAGVFVQIGLIPNNEWLKCSELALTRFGEIEIDALGETSMLGVFAAGDATRYPTSRSLYPWGRVPLPR
jgi:alkyl hydroperoxide reductase subunit F